MPSTTLGFSLRIICQLCKHALARLKGSISLVSKPLPRKPPKLTASNGNPWLGTKRYSIPVVLPSQATCQPRVRRSSATANPGKICPPVPPAMTKMEGLFITCLPALRRGFHNQSLVKQQAQRHSSKSQSRHS